MMEADRRRDDGVRGVRPAQQLSDIANRWALVSDSTEKTCHRECNSLGECVSATRCWGETTRPECLTLISRDGLLNGDVHGSSVPRELPQLRTRQTCASGPPVGSLNAAGVVLAATHDRRDRSFDTAPRDMSINLIRQRSGCRLGLSTPQPRKYSGRHRYRVLPMINCCLPVQSDLRADSVRFIDVQLPGVEWHALCAFHSIVVFTRKKDQSG